MADNVIKKVIDMRKGKTAILPSIVTNPELTGEEESLKSVGINGTNFTIGGGDGQLKLVATGVFSEAFGDCVNFNLNNALEVNKAYLIKYYNAGFPNGAYISQVCICGGSSLNTLSPCVIYQNGNYANGYIVLRTDYIGLCSYDMNSLPAYSEENDRLEIYELPLTFSEEPKAHWVDSRESSLLRRLERGREIGR